AHVPSELTAGTGTVGVRVPSHRVPRALVTHLDGAITAPSANRTGAAPPTTPPTPRASSATEPLHWPRSASRGTSRGWGPAVRGEHIDHMQITGVIQAGGRS